MLDTGKTPTRSKATWSNLGDVYFTKPLFLKLTTFLVTDIMNENECDMTFDVKPPENMRSDWRDMRIGWLRSRLAEAESNLSRARQKIYTLKQIIVDMCHLFNIDEPDFRFERYVPKQSAGRYEAMEEENSEDVFEDDSGLEQNLLTELLMNSRKRARRHSIEAKKFYSIVYLQGSTAYTALSRVLPLPSVKTIQRALKPSVQTIQERLETIEKTVMIFREMKERWGDASLLGTLAVDACSHSTCSNPGSPPRGDNVTGHSQCFPSHYCFAFYYQPMDASIPCTVVHVTTERTGKANEKHRKILHIISEVAKREGFTILMLCSDGDSAYMPETSSSRTYLQSQNPGAFVNMKSLKKLGKQLRKSEVELFGADMPHILKNARSRMLREDVAMNLRQPVKLEMEKIKSLNIPQDCFCNSDLSKMVDSYPLYIFTLDNVRQLFDQSAANESMFLLWFALFHAFFRGVCSIETRLRMGLCFLNISNLYTTYFTTMVKAGMCKCGEYRRRAGGCVTLFPMKHIERMIVTVATVMGVITTSVEGEEIALDRFSTHPLENFFGQLRVLCRFKHSYSNILKKAAQTAIIKQMKHELGISDWIAKRVNVAGQRITIPTTHPSVQDTEMINVAKSIMFFIDPWYTTQVLEKTQDPQEHKNRIASFLKELATVTLPQVNLIGDYSGQQILTRLIRNSQVTSQEETSRRNLPASQ